jgi:2-keto-4-pentenoate hydratase/2-oxohepta-3-ene-1,7-dioic acid hydratase in catechol pathway
MKFRKVMIAEAVTVQALHDGQWLSLNRVEGFDRLTSESRANAHVSDLMLDVLRLDPRHRCDLQAKLGQLEPEVAQPTATLLPFNPASFRDFMLYEKHVIDASRGFARRFMPQAYKLARFAEVVTRRPFPRFRPHRLWYKQPIYYFGNHLNFGVSGETISWPSYSRALDYELEIGAVLTSPLMDATAEQAADAIGGFVILNDFSARDVQKEEMDSGFGPQKSKHFRTTVSAVVVTADEILPEIENLNATVTINGAEVVRCHSGGMQFSIAEAIAFAARGEQLYPGELFGTGTIPGGAGVENGRWLKDGDTVSFHVEGLGELTNAVSKGSSQ